MISFKLTEARQFMSQLLLSDTFDQFYFIKGEIVTFNIFQIDGRMQKQFFQPEETEGSPLPEYSSWRQIREYCYSIIKGRRTPLGFKFIFSLPPENTARLIRQYTLDFQPENVQGLYLNIRFDEKGLHCVTGTSLKVFSPEKPLEKAWDKTVQKFFDQKGIAWEAEM